MAESQKVDPITYWGYLFEPDKKPTKLLDALLRGIANYIVRALVPYILLIINDLACGLHVLTIYRSNLSATKKFDALNPRSWQPSTRLWAATMMVRCAGPFFSALALTDVVPQPSSSICQILRYHTFINQ